MRARQLDIESHAGGANALVVENLFIPRMQEPAPHCSSSSHHRANEFRPRPHQIIAPTTNTTQKLTLTMDRAPRLRVTGAVVGMNAWAAARKERARTEMTRIVLGGMWGCGLLCGGGGWGGGWGGEAECENYGGVRQEGSRERQRLQARQPNTTSYELSF